MQRPSGTLWRVTGQRVDDVPKATGPIGIWDRDACSQIERDSQGRRQPAPSAHARAALHTGVKHNAGRILTTPRGRGRCPHREPQAGGRRWRSRGRLSSQEPPDDTDLISPAVPGQSPHQRAAEGAGEKPSTRQFVLLLS